MIGRRLRPLGLGLVGCGFVTRGFHLPALRGVADVKVVAVADVDEAALHEVADSLSIERRYLAASELVQDPRVEAVGVCVPPEAHAAVASLALDAGKHVLVEKPLALSRDDAADLVERAAHSPAVAVMGFNLRWHRLVRQARATLSSGRLGDILCVRSIFSDSVLDSREVAPWRVSRELGGGALLDRAVHHFDLWRWLLGDEVEEVFAASRSDRAHDDAVVVAARMRAGTIVTLAAFDTSATHHALEIYGDGGALTLDLYRSDGLEIAARDVLTGALSRRLRRAGRSVTRLLGGGLRGDFSSSYREQWRHFAEAVRGDADPACGLEDGRRALEIALAAAHSAEEGRPVEVNSHLAGPVSFQPSDQLP